jgi:hypothetical protein
MAVEIMLSLYLCGSFAAGILNLGPRLRCVVSYMCLALYLPVSKKQRTGRAPTDSVKAVRKNIYLQYRESNPDSSVAQTVVQSLYRLSHPGFE